MSFDPTRISPKQGLDLVVAALFRQASLLEGGASEEEERETLFGALLAAGITSKALIQSIHRYRDRVVLP